MNNSYTELNCMAFVVTDEHGWPAVEYDAGLIELLDACFDYWECRGYEENTRSVEFIGKLRPEFVVVQRKMH